MAQCTEGARFTLTDTCTCVISAHRACVRGWGMGQSGGCGSGPLLSEGPAPRPPSHPCKNVSSCVCSFTGSYPTSICRAFCGWGGEGLRPTEGQGLTARAGDAEPGSDSGKDGACPVDRGAWEGARLSPAAHSCSEKLPGSRV